MTQRVTTFFGLKLEVRNEPDPEILAQMRKLLEKELAAQKIEVPKDATVYVKQLLLRAADSHFTVQGIRNRLAHLEVEASITQNARRAGTLRLVDLKCALSPAVEVTRKSDRIEYRLNGEYVEERGQHSEYLAVIVHPECRDFHKKLEIRVRAQATPEFAKRLHNVENGAVITGLEFVLSRYSQLTFNFARS